MIPLQMSSSIKIMQNYQKYPCEITKAKFLVCEDTDKVLVFQDGINKTEIKVHSFFLERWLFFQHLFFSNPGIETLYLSVPDADVMQDIIYLIYGLETPYAKRKNVNWLIKKYICEKYLYFDTKLTFPETINFSSIYMPLLLRAIDIEGLYQDTHILSIFFECCPIDTDVSYLNSQFLESLKETYPFDVVYKLGHNIYHKIEFPREKISNFLPDLEEEKDMISFTHDMCHCLAINKTTFTLVSYDEYEICSYESPTRVYSSKFVNRGKLFVVVVKNIVTKFRNLLFYKTRGAKFLFLIPIFSNDIAFYANNNWIVCLYNNNFEIYLTVSGKKIHEQLLTNIAIQSRTVVLTDNNVIALCHLSGTVSIMILDQEKRIFHTELKNLQCDMVNNNTILLSGILGDTYVISEMNIITGKIELIESYPLGEFKDQNIEGMYLSYYPHFFIFWTKNKIFVKNLTKTYKYEIYHGEISHLFFSERKRKIISKLLSS